MFFELMDGELAYSFSLYFGYLIFMNRSPAGSPLQKHQSWESYLKKSLKNYAFHR